MAGLSKEYASLAKNACAETTQVTAILGEIGAIASRSMGQ